jgi:hypothetical protein
MTPLQTAAQQALEALELGALMCEVTAASMLRVALADEQAQSQNECIISDANASREGFYKGMFAVIHGEQAQAVKPVAVFDIAVTEKMAVIYYDCLKHGLKSGDKLYTHQAPPPAGERAELIAGLRGSAEVLRAEDCGAIADEIVQAADMLEADVVRSNKLADAIAADRNYWREKAQQVAVPAGYALVPIVASRCYSDKCGEYMIKTTPIGHYRAMLAAAQEGKP